MNVMIVSICACVISQLIKVIITSVQKKRLDFHALIATGGMPSSHSAIVSALVTSVAIVEGLESVAFGISVIFALTVLLDAAGLRRSVGKQAVILNRIVKELKERRAISDFEQEPHELIGHTALQVIAGACLGVAVAYLWLPFLA